MVLVQFLITVLLESCQKTKLPTAKDDEVDKVFGFELGADDYVTKPFSVRELILRVKAILKRNTKTSNPSNQTHEINRNFGSLKMNVESHEVSINIDTKKESMNSLKLRSFIFNLRSPYSILERSIRSLTIA